MFKNLSRRFFFWERVLYSFVFVYNDIFMRSFIEAFFVLVGVRVYFWRISFGVYEMKYV